MKKNFTTNCTKDEKYILNLLTEQMKLTKDQDSFVTTTLNISLPSLNPICVLADEQQYWVF